MPDPEYPFAPFRLLLLLPAPLMLYAFPTSRFSPLKIPNVIFTFLYFISSQTTHISLSRLPLQLFILFYLRPEKKNRRKEVKTFLRADSDRRMLLLPLIVSVYVCMKWKNNAPKSGILIFLQYIFISI